MKSDNEWISQLKKFFWEPEKFSKIVSILLTIQPKKFFASFFWKQCNKKEIEDTTILITL